MNRKFECWDCKKTFEADDAKWVECPYCHSDNVEYFHRHIPRKAYYGVLCALLLAGVGYGLYHIVSSSKENKQVTREECKTESDVIAQKIDSAYLAEGGTIEPLVSISEIEYNEDNNTYKCRFQVDYPPEQPWKIVIMSYRGNKVIAESENGEFDALPYSQFDGFYIVRLLDRETNKPLIDDKEFPNFSKQVRISKPWTAAILEKHINGSENLTDNIYLADKHEVIILNKPKHDATPTGTLREVQTMLKQCGLHAKVISVEYNDLKQISTAKLKINYPANWMKEQQTEEEEEEIGM